jgi:GTPase involved in cell partitioning and DNA repair
MRKLIGLLCVSLAAVACTPKEDYKTVRDEVMKFHDEVMVDQSTVVNNQMKLDTLLKDLKGLKARFPDIDTAKEKVTITGLIADLTKAEDSMNDWMHKFEPDVTGKSNEVAVQYFKAEKAKIAAVDSLYKKEIKSSGDYLSKFKK